MREHLGRATFGGLPAIGVQAMLNFHHFDFLIVELLISERGIDAPSDGVFENIGLPDILLFLLFDHIRNIVFVQDARVGLESTRQVRNELRGVHRLFLACGLIS